MEKRLLSFEALLTDYYGKPRVMRDSETGCLLWSGRLDRDGYAARVKIGGKEYRPHRLSYELYFGTVPDVIDHNCHTLSECKENSKCVHRRCIEPTHLDSVTVSENIARGNTGIHKKSQTHCKHGHEFTLENTITRKNGTRKCRECARRIDREYLERKRQK